MRKLDLDELERIAHAVIDTRSPLELAQWCARQATDDRRWRDEQMEPASAHVVANAPGVTLALVTRIRELDEALNDALAYTIPGDERDRLVRVLAKGCVLP